MYTVVRALVSTQDGLITRNQARRSGLDDQGLQRLVRDGDLVRVRRGVYADGDAWAGLDEFRGRPLMRVRAAHLTITTGHWFSHDSAALLHDVPLEDAGHALVHLTRPGVLGSRTKAGVNHHRAWIALDQMTTVAELPCLDLARTAVDLTRQHGVVPGVAACDAALRRGVTRDRLVAAYAPMHCWPGLRAAREAVSLADPGAENFAESATRCLVHQIGIGWPETQFGLRHAGRTVFCDLRVGRHVFEFDGHLKYRQADASGALLPGAERILWEEKQRQDFICGFKLGMSRVTYRDLYAGRAQARQRLRREFLDTAARFGTSIEDLAPYVVRRPSN